MARRPPKDVENARGGEYPINVAARSKIDELLRHLPEQDRANPHMRVAAMMTLTTGAPLPKSAAETEREHRRGEIMAAERRYAERGNPMEVFRAYLWARNLGDPLPEWVLLYLDQSISCFWSAYEAFFKGEHISAPRKRNDPAEAFANAFGIKRGKGLGTIWGGSNKSEFFGDIVISLAEETSKNGSRFNITWLIEQASAELLKSRTAGWKAWKRFEDAFPERVAALKQLPGFFGSPSRGGP